MAEIVKANIANALNSLSGVLGTSDQIVDSETGNSIKSDLEKQFYISDLTLDELVPHLGYGTVTKLSELRQHLSNKSLNLILIKGRLESMYGTYSVATVVENGSSFSFFVDDNGTTVEVSADSQNHWTCTRTTPYVKPANGIPSTDLGSAVQTSLGKADSALQSVTSQDVTGALGFTPESAANKVTSLSASSTNTQYPSAKCVYDSIEAVKDVFWAEYGVTTFNEISSALNDGKLPIVLIFDRLYVYSTSTSEYHSFTTSMSNRIFFVNINISNVWNTGGYVLENLSNRRATITDNQTSDNYYPTTKAVADYAEAKTNKVTSLSDQSTDVEYPSAKCVWNLISKSIDGFNLSDVLSSTEDETNIVVDLNNSISFEHLLKYKYHVISNNAYFPLTPHLDNTHVEIDNVIYYKCLFEYEDKYLNWDNDPIAYGKKCATTHGFVIPTYCRSENGHFFIKFAGTVTEKAEIVSMANAAIGHGYGADFNKYFLTT